MTYIENWIFNPVPPPPCHKIFIQKFSFTQTPFPPKCWTSFINNPFTNGRLKTKIGIKLQMFLLLPLWRLLFLSIKSIQSNALKPSKNTLNFNITELLSLIPLSSTSIIIFFQEDSKINLEILLGDLSKHFMISQVFIPHRSLNKLNLSAQKRKKERILSYLRIITNIIIQN